MKISPKFASLYNKLILRYPGKWYEGYQQQLLHNAFDLYPNFHAQLRESEKELDKQHSRRKRVRRYIRNMIECRGYHIPCLVSLTFTDDCLSSTSFSTRKSYVREYLNDTFNDWYACVDYGKAHGREHYHAIALFPCNVRFFTFQKKRKTFMLPHCPRFDWSYGFYSIRPLEIDASNIYKTLNYAYKSSNYAFKSSDSEIKPFHKRNCFIEIPEDLF